LRKKQQHGPPEGLAVSPTRSGTRGAVCKAAGVVLGPPFDWNYWRDSARELEPKHATVAFDVSTEPVASSSAGASIGALDRARKTRHDVIAALIAEIRRRMYSIRTE
jgi:hypothetical protein